MALSSPTSFATTRDLFGVARRSPAIAARGSSSGPIAAVTCAGDWGGDLDERALPYIALPGARGSIELTESNTDWAL